MADTYVPDPSPQSNSALPARFDSWLPGSSSSSSGSKLPAPTPESVAGVTAAPPATAALSSDSIYGSAVSPVLLLAGLLVLSVVLSSGRQLAWAHNACCDLLCRLVVICVRVMAQVTTAWCAPSLL